VWDDEDGVACICHTDGINEWMGELPSNQDAHEAATVGTLCDHAGSAVER
jgi:hypothetical protein